MKIWGALYDFSIRLVSTWGKWVLQGEE